MLEVKVVDSGYGKRPVLFGVSLMVHPGEIVAIIGPNGSGKSTLLKVVYGLLPVWRGEVVFSGALTTACSPADLMRRGIAFVPQGNRVFPNLSVLENLEIGGLSLPKNALKARMEAVLGQFPILGERLTQNAARLSGGEQQMLALARALLLEPKLLLVDEPSLGLSPAVVGSVLEGIRLLNRRSEVAVLVVEQKVHEVLSLCHRVYGLRMGRIVFDGSSESLQTDKDRLRTIFL